MSIHPPQGKMADDWPLLEPQEIDDPDDKKPSDWVDDPMMDDKDDKKPDDWDQPKQIADEKAKKPDVGRCCSLCWGCSSQADRSVGSCVFIPGRLCSGSCV